MKKVIVVGGGFGGLNVCKELAGHTGLQVDLIDRRNHHLFQPLLYQVAMAGLNPSDIAIPFRQLFAKSPNINPILAEVSDIDLDRKRVQYDGSWHGYDYLVMACGAKHSYFGQGDWERVAPGLKNLEQATEIRRRILTAFEMAEKSEDPKLQQAYLNFVIIGAGPTGVELAGALAEMTFKTLYKEYKRADLKKTRITLVEASDRVLGSFPRSLSQTALQNLKELGVEVRLNARASDLSNEGLNINGEEVISRTVIWAAGVEASSITRKIPSEKDRQGRIKVERDLSITGHSEVFVIGDQAYFENETGKSLPGVAQVAIQQGQFAAEQIQNDLLKQTRGVFKYFDKGNMATIGRSKAIAETGPLRFSGFVAWALWATIHIAFIASFKKRVFVFLNWVWSYFTFGRHARLIVAKSWRFYDGKAIDLEKRD